MANVEFNYEGKEITIQCNKNDNMEKIFQQFMAKVGGKSDTLAFLYNGSAITNMNLTFDQLSNSDDKNRNKMNILVCNSSTNFSNQFIFQDCIGVDQSMKDYAKMAILLAMQENPSDYPEMSKMIALKFKEKYGGNWFCSFVKEGGIYLCCGFDYCLKIKYGDYKIAIAKTSN